MTGYSHRKVPQDGGLYPAVSIRDGVEAFVEAQVPGDRFVRVVGGVQQLVDSLQFVHPGNGVSHVEVLNKIMRMSQTLQTYTAALTFSLSSLGGFFTAGFSLAAF